MLRCTVPTAPFNGHRLSLPLSFPASLARGGNTPLSIGDHCFGNCHPRFKWEGANEWFELHSLKKLSKWNVGIHYSMLDVEFYARCRISSCTTPYFGVVLRIDRSIVSVYFDVHILCMSLRNGRVAWWSIFLGLWICDWVAEVNPWTLQSALIELVYCKGMRQGEMVKTSESQLCRVTRIWFAEIDLENLRVQ